MEIAMLAKTNSLANSIVLVLHLIRTESVSSNVLTHVFTNRPRLYQVFQRFSRLESKNKQRHRKHAATEDVKYRIGYQYQPMFAGMYWTIGISAKSNIGTTLVLCALLTEKSGYR